MGFLRQRVRERERVFDSFILSCGSCMHAHAKHTFSKLKPDVVRRIATTQLLVSPALVPSQEDDGVLRSAR